MGLAGVLLQKAMTPIPTLLFPSLVTCPTRHLAAEIAWAASLTLPVARMPTITAKVVQHETTMKNFSTKLTATKKRPSSSSIQQRHSKATCVDSSLRQPRGDNTRKDSGKSMPDVSSKVEEQHYSNKIKEAVVEEEELDGEDMAVGETMDPELTDRHRLVCKQTGSKWKKLTWPSSRSFSQRRKNHPRKKILYGADSWTITMMPTTRYPLVLQFH